MSKPASADSGWLNVPLKSVTIDVPSWDPSTRPDDEFTYVDISSIDNQTCRIVEPKRMHGREAPSRARRPIQEGDVLFSNVRTYLRNVAQVSGLDEPAVASTGFTLLRPTTRIRSRYLYHFVRSDFFINEVTPEQTGTHYPATSDRVVRGQLIPLPSAGVQDHVARLIDAVELSRESATHHLDAGRLAVEHFRQAVLAAACSGRLTADWRDTHGDTRTVERALTELSSTKRGRTADDDLSGLPFPDLPDSYVVSTVGGASVAIEYGTSKRADTGGVGVPVLRMGNIQNGQLELDDLKYMPRDREIERLILEDSDLLFNRTNSPELVGKSAVFHEQIPMTFASYLIRVRFAPDIADADFVNFWINSAWGKAWARQVKTDGVSQSNINGTKLGAMPLPLPPIEEQREIVRRASHMLEPANRLLIRVDTAADRLERSSQAVLARAFRGELPQGNIPDQARLREMDNLRDVILPDRSPSDS